MLRVRDLNARYGVSHVLRNVSLDVGDHETVAVLGRNGVGKTTLAHTIMGIVRPSGGSVELFGRDVAGWPAHKISRLGIALVPQGRRIFASLSVEENLRLGSAHGGSREQTWTMERVLTVFPALAPRLRAQGSHLSGGEQQMLAIARALLSNPRILVLDEPSEGLAPIIVQRVIEILRDLACQGISLLLVEQNLRVALELATSVCVVVKGEVAYRDSTTAFLERPDIAERLLGVSVSNMARG